MSIVKAGFRAALRGLRAAAAWLDARDVHFYGGLVVTYVGARALEPELALMFVGLVLMAVGLLYRGKA